MTSVNKVPTHNRQHHAKQVVITMPEPTEDMVKVFGQTAKVAIAAAMKNRLHSIGYVTKKDNSGRVVHAIVGTIASTAAKGKLSYKLVRYEAGGYTRHDIGGMHQDSVDYLAGTGNRANDGAWITDSDLTVTMGRILTPVKAATV